MPLQFQQASPTATSNRVCAPVTACSGDEYQIGAPTETSDRVCKRLTICAFAVFPFNEYEVRAAKAINLAVSSVAGYLLHARPTSVSMGLAVAELHGVCNPCATRLGPWHSWLGLAKV